MRLLSTLFVMGIFACSIAVFAQTATPTPTATAAAAVTTIGVNASGGLLSWLYANAGLVFGILWGLAETLALIPSVKSNSVFTLIFNLLQSVKSKFPDSTTPPAA